MHGCKLDIVGPGQWLTVKSAADMLVPPCSHVDGSSGTGCGGRSSANGPNLACMQVPCQLCRLRARLVLLAMTVHVLADDGRIEPDWLAHRQ